jgi:adenosylcobinamide-phosphate synthase
MIIVRSFMLLVALILDRLVGDPDWLWARVPHPVVWFGKSIGLADRHLNRSSASAKNRRFSGLVAIIVLLTLSLAVGAIIHGLLAPLALIGMIVEILIVAIFLAQKSLADHVQKVADGLRDEGLDGGRKAVAMIVGRDPETLDEPAVCRASIESLAENFSDGAVAPAFWYLLLGLPGLLAYKMLNTADSMIGHKSEKYLYFGWASARLDDAANYVPARLSVAFLAFGALMVSGWKSAKRCIAVALADHGHHRSPNSGWPEAAMAGALDIQLAGPRVYGGVLVDEPMLNATGSGSATALDITLAIAVFYAACQSMALVLAASIVLWAI